MDERPTELSPITLARRITRWWAMPGADVATVEFGVATSPSAYVGFLMTLQFSFFLFCFFFFFVFPSYS
jgi:hypothetical protein